MDELGKDQQNCGSERWSSEASPSDRETKVRPVGKKQEGKWYGHKVGELVQRLEL